MNSKFLQMIPLVMLSPPSFPSLSGDQGSLPLLGHSTFLQCAESWVSAVSPLSSGTQNLG